MQCNAAEITWAEVYNSIQVKWYRDMQMHCIETYIYTAISILKKEKIKILN